MNWEALAAIIGSIGGLEFIRWLFERRGRKQQSEFHLLQEIVQFLQQQLKEKEQRFSEQTDLVRDLNRKGLEAEKTISDLRLELERKRCDRLDCGKRKPPNAFTPVQPET